MMRVYLDNCCFNRPFDDQESQTIFLESEAKLMIQDLIREKKLELVWSFILEYENDANPDDEVMEKISKWKDLAVHIQLGSPEITQNSKIFREQGIAEKDSLHLACAVESKSDFFITTDKGIIKKREKIIGIEILNPTEFIINKWRIK